MIEIEDSVAERAQYLLLSEESLTWDEAVSQASQEKDQWEERSEEDDYADDFHQPGRWVPAHFRW